MAWIRTIRSQGYLLSKFFSTSSATFQGEIITKVENGIRTITLSNPRHLNAISNQMYIDLTSTMYEADKDPATKIVAITGTGRFFTSGNEFGNFHSSGTDSMSSDKGAVAERVTVMIDNVRNFVDELIDLRKPLIALVNGPALGIGVTMLAHCDAVYATESAYFTTPFTVLGICPEACSSYLFPRIMGHAKASSLLMLNAKLTAEEAKGCGIVTQVFPENDFHSATQKILEDTSNAITGALTASKELLRGPELRKTLHIINRLELAAIAKLLVTEECHDACECILHPRKRK